MPGIKDAEYEALVTEIFPDAGQLDQCISTIGKAVRKDHAAYWRVPTPEEQADALVRQGINADDARWLCGIQAEVRAEGVLQASVVRRYLETIREVARLLGVKAEV